MRLASLVAGATVILDQSLPSRLSVFRSVFQPLSFRFFDDTVGRTGYGKKKRALEILVRLFPSPLGNDDKCHGVIGAQTRRWLGLSVKHIEGGFTVERKANTNLVLVLEIFFVAFVSEDRAAFIAFVVLTDAAFYMATSRH